MGQETEYAIRFTPLNGVRPGNNLIFLYFKSEIASRVATKEGILSSYNEQFFTANSGSFNYEFTPADYSGGLMEAATPETTSPAELLLYQQAQEKLIRKCIPDHDGTVTINGVKGQLGFIKNCRDPDGKIYGAQENYEAMIARGFKLFCYRIGVSLLILLSFPFQIFSVLISILFQLFFLVVAFRRIHGLEQIRNQLYKFMYYVLYAPQFLISVLAQLHYKLFAFRNYKKQLLPFLISRCIITGAGTLCAENTFALSEKGSAVNRVNRFSLSPKIHAIVDTNNLLKALFVATQRMLLCHFTDLKNLFKQKQRLQIGFSDSNRCQVAEYLKWGTTAIVLDLIEAGCLKTAPALNRPLQALRQIVFDPSLQVKVKLKNRTAQSALQLQYFYLQQAKTFYRQQKNVSMEVYEILTLWEEVLQQLAADPASLLGRIDWVTKRYLLTTAGRDLDYPACKKIDIGYHELKNGYYDLLEDAGFTLRMFSDEEIERAINTPPSSPRAQARSRFIRDLSCQSRKVKISWDSASVRQNGRQKIISFDDTRR